MYRLFTTDSFILSILILLFSWGYFYTSFISLIILFFIKSVIFEYTLDKYRTTYSLNKGIIKKASELD